MQRAGRRRFEILLVAGWALAASGCVTVAEYRKLEDRVARMERSGGGGGDAASREAMAEAGAEIDALRREIGDLRGRLEVAAPAPIRDGAVLKIWADSAWPGGGKQGRHPWGTALFSVRWPAPGFRWVRCKIRPAPNGGASARPTACARRVMRAQKVSSSSFRLLDRNCGDDGANGGAK